MFKFGINKFRFNKIANITVSFSWVFMFIVGSIFIIIGYSIISTYQQTEEYKFNLEQKLIISNILSKVGRTLGIEENSLIFTQGLFKDTYLKVQCVENFSILNLNGNLDPNNNFLEEYPTFNLQIKKSSVPSVYFAIGNFKMPFKVSNLLGIVSKKNLLILDENSPITNRYLFLLNKGSFTDLSYMVLDFKNDWDLDYFKNLVQEKNLFSIVFLTDKENFESYYSNYNLLNIRNFENYFLIINEENIISSDNSNLPKSYGNLTYIDNQKNEISFNFINYDGSFSLPLMAAFSSPEAFECATNNLLNKVKQSYKFYILKADYLYNLSNSDLDVELCSKSLEFGVEEKYKKVYSVLNETYNKINESAFNDKFELFTLIEELEKSEEDLIKFNCIEVY
jgi:hypothetical protein